MKQRVVLSLSVAALAAVALAACGKKETSTATSEAPAMSAAPASSAASAMSSMSTMSAAPAAKTGDSTGVVKAVDASAGTVTLDHQPIPGVGWPAMTMTFKAASRELLSGIKPGDKVAFSVRIEGDNNQVTAISKQ